MKTIFLSVLFTIVGLFYQNEIFSQVFSAKYNKTIVDSLALKMDSTVELLSVESDSVLLNGNSLSWKYQYRSNKDSTVVNYFFHTTMSTAIFDSSNEIVLIGSTTITKPWIDSDSALMIAEAQGGKEFRDKNPNYKIKMTLSEPLTPSPSTRWYVYYISLDTYLVLFVNINADTIISGVSNLLKLTA